jgi:hypothetical protein
LWVPLHSLLSVVFSFRKLWPIQFYLHLIICSVTFVSFVCFHSSSFVVITGQLTLLFHGGIDLQNFEIFYNYLRL